VNNPSSNKHDSKARRLGFALVALLFLAAWILGYVGYDQCYREVGKQLPWWDLAYMSFQLFGLEFNVPVVGSSPAPLVVGRSLALLFTASAALLALAGICRNEICALRLARLRGHAVVCGAGKKAEALIRDLLCAGMPVVAIDLKTDKPLPACGVFSRFFVIQGDATRAEILARAQVRHAAHIFVMTGNDSVNIETASQVIQQARSHDSAGRRGKPVCHVHMVDRHAGDLFRNHSVFKDYSAYISVRMFNVYDNAARLFWQRELIRRAPTAPNDPRRFHVAIAGMGEMGEAVMLRVIKSAHFANGRKPAFTLVDLQADRVRERLAQRHPALESLCEIGWIDGEMSAADTQCRIAQRLSSPDDIGIVVICADDDHGNFVTALQTALHLSATDIPIFVRLSTSAGLAEILRDEKSEAALAHRIEAFGLVTECCSVDVVLENRLFRFAREFHRAYVANRAKAGVPDSDPSMKKWEALDESLRESNCEQAEHLKVKLLTAGIPPEAAGHSHPVAFNDKQVEILARMEHARWYAERRLAGWTYAPPPKNVAHRTSPHLVPWEELDESIRQIDRDAVQAIAPVMVDLTGSSPAPTHETS
jgi:hypothetical protein